MFTSTVSFGKKILHSRYIVATAFFFGVLLLSSPRVFATVKLPSIFSDGMVLQRNAKVPVWGWATPNEKIVVEIAGQRSATQADASGNWRVNLTPQPEGGPFELKVFASNRLTFKDVYFGEVWICAGQSNMSFPLRNSLEGKHEVETATYQRIRLLTVPAKYSEAPLSDFDARWQTCSPKSVANFSAVAYYFGCFLHEKLNVAVGLIVLAWGGSTGEAWVDRSKLTKYPELSPLLDEKRLASLPQNQRAGGLFNGMLSPVSPYAIKGVVWYQGESNANRAWQYRTLLPILIANWRETWEQGDFPFYLVQLPNFMATLNEPSSSAWAELREAQHKTTSVRNVEEIVTIDVGEENNLHPKDKRTLGYRLSLLALAKTYGYDVPFSGPEFRSIKIDDNKAILMFTNTGTGLKISKSSDADVKLQGFSIAGEDQKFFWADAVVENDSIVVSSPDVPKPVAVRYAWANNPKCNLTNDSELPASPFRTDNWAGVTVNVQ